MSVSGAQSRVQRWPSESLRYLHKNICNRFATKIYLVAGSRMSVSGTHARSSVGRGPPPRLLFARRFSAAKRCGKSSCPCTCG